MKYKTFLWTFIISFIAGIVCLAFYLKAIFSVVKYTYHNPEPMPFEILERIFTPELVIAFIIMIIASLTYRIIGIVFVAKNKIIGSGEKAIWIIGFVLFGFIAAIVFLVLAKSRKLVETDAETTS